jgi:hypothetical protein
MSTPKDKTSPGPYVAHSHGGCFYIFGPKGAMIADDGADEVDGALARIRGVGRGATAEEQEANAHLFAASWQMRAALREADKALSLLALGRPLYCGPHAVLLIVREALAAAEPKPEA